MSDGTPPTEADGGAGRFDPAFAWKALQAGVVFLVLAFFLYSIRDLLTPFILFWVLVAVLMPFRGTAGHTLLTVLAAVLTLFWLLDTTGFLLAPFVLALVLAYILDPLVDRMVRPGLPRSPAILLLVLPVLGLSAVALFVGVPALGDQMADLVQRTPQTIRRFAAWAEAVQERFLRLDLPLVDEDRALERLRAVDSETVVEFFEARRDEIAQWLWGGVLGVGRGIGSAVTVLGYVVLTPVLTFYLLRDYDRLMERIRELVPAGSRDAVVSLAREYDDLLSGYLRGQVTVALSVGVITGLGLWIAQFPYAFLLGAIVAVFSVVPYLGLLLSLIPAVFIALVSGAVWVSLAKVGVVYGVAQGLEGAVISPRIVGESVGLHPVWVVLALAVGGFFFGFVGLLIAVPVAVGIKLLVLRGLERYRASDLYREG